MSVYGQFEFLSKYPQFQRHFSSNVLVFATLKKLNIETHDYRTKFSIVTFIFNWNIDVAPEFPYFQRYFVPFGS